MAADFGDLASGWPGTNDLKAEIARRKADRARREVEQRVDEIRERCQTFRGFIREAWHVLEPVTNYVECWHHGAIAEHMEAVTAGQITRLQINQPPGTMKLCADDTVVMTPSGKRAHGDLKVGDAVFGPDGRPRKILATTPDAPADYLVAFSTGESVRCNGDHLWRVFDRYTAKWK